MFKFKHQITGKTGNGGTKDVEMMVPLKYLSDSWRTIEMPLINCEISLQLTCSKKCFLVPGTATNQMTDSKITATKRYVPVIFLSTQDNIKLPKQLQSGFNRIINGKTYLSNTTSQTQNRYSYFLINASFQGVNRLFVVSFKDANGW